MDGLGYRTGMVQELTEKDEALTYFPVVSVNHLTKIEKRLQYCVFTIIRLKYLADIEVVWKNEYKQAVDPILLVHWKTPTHGREVASPRRSFAAFMKRR